MLKPGGTFYATFFANELGRRHVEPIPRSYVTTFYDHDPFHYDTETFRWVCEGTGFELEVIGDWGHPRDQRMRAFPKR